MRAALPNSFMDVSGPAVASPRRSAGKLSVASPLNVAVTSEATDSCSALEALARIAGGIPQLNLESQAKATKGKAGTAGAQGPVRQTTAGTGLRVGVSGAGLTTTSEFMDVTGGESAATNSVSPDRCRALCRNGESEPSVTAAWPSGESSSCGGVESRHAGESPLGDASLRSGPNRSNDQEGAGIASGPRDSITNPPLPADTAASSPEPNAPGFDAAVTLSKLADDLSDFVAEINASLHCDPLPSFLTEPFLEYAADSLVISKNASTSRMRAPSMIQFSSASTNIATA